MNRFKPIEQTSVAKKPERQIRKGHRFSIKKTFVVHEKTMTLRFCLWWKPTDKIFKSVGLRWVPTGKIFTFSTTKVNSEPTNSSNEDITNPYECGQTLNVNAGTLNLSADAPVTRTASAAAKPCQEDSFELYLITGSYTVVAVSHSSCSRIHYHMLMLKLQRHTISIKIQESRKLKIQRQRLSQTLIYKIFLQDIQSIKGRSSVNLEADLVDVVTIGIPSLSGDGFTKETIHVMTPHIITTFNVITPTVEKTNDGFQTVGKKKKRKGKSKSTNAGQFTSPSVKHNVRYEPKATTTAPKKGATYVGNTSQSSSMLKTTGNSSKKHNHSMSNSFSALNDEEEDDAEDVEIMHDESANLNIKAGGSSSFTAAAG
ncbi:hypothetical protein Tco_0425762 [Tanacetum coccineum]